MPSTVSGSDADPAIRSLVLPRFEVASGARVTPLGNGLINETYAVAEPAGGRRFVLQRVNPLFPAAIHLNIQAVTARLAAAGLATPLLVPTRDGQACLELAPPAGTAPGAGGRVGSVWRLMTFVEGVSFDVVGTSGQARAAGALIARFHGALEGLDHPFVGLRTGVHDTARHLATLERAVIEHGGHRLHE